MSQRAREGSANSARAKPLARGTMPTAGPGAQARDGAGPSDAGGASPSELGDAKVPSSASQEKNLLDNIKDFMAGKPTAV
jgi:hypothetical protein